MIASIENAIRGLGLVATAISRLEGGYSGSLKFHVDLSDQRCMFLKCGEGDFERKQLAVEFDAYQSYTLPCMPELLGYGDFPSGSTWLAIECLEGWRWPPPWSPRDLCTAADAVQELSTVGVVGGTSAYDSASLQGGWQQVSHEPLRFLRLGMRDEGWLDARLADLISIDTGNRFEGTILVHGDLRSDNMCLRNGQAKLVDWGSASSGPEMLDQVLWLPSLVSEIGYVPTRLSDASQHPFMVSFAGYLAARAGLPEPDGTRGVRSIQRRQLRYALDLMEASVR